MQGCDVELFEKGRSNHTGKVSIAQSRRGRARRADAGGSPKKKETEKGNIGNRKQKGKKKKRKRKKKKSLGDYDVSRYKELKTPRQDKQRREEEKEAQIGMGRE